MALSLGKKTRLPRPDPKSTLLQMVLKQVVTLPLERQDSIAIEILDSLAEADPKSARFQQLIENKYTAGLSAEECTELEGLEGNFRKSDDAFYGPILERIERSEQSGTLVMQFSEEIGKISMAEILKNAPKKPAAEWLRSLIKGKNSQVAPIPEPQKIEETIEPIVAAVLLSVPIVLPVASDAVRQEIHRLREQAKIKFAEQYAKAQAPAATIVGGRENPPAKIVRPTATKDRIRKL